MTLTIVFHDDLIKYYTILRRFRKRHNEVSKEIQKYMGKTKKSKDEWTILDNEVNDFIIELIKELGEYKIFDVSKETFLDNNKGIAAVSEAEKTIFWQQSAIKKIVYCGCCRINKRRKERQIAM